MLARVYSAHVALEQIHEEAAGPRAADLLRQEVLVSPPWRTFLRSTSGAVKAHQPARNFALNLRRVPAPGDAEHALVVDTDDGAIFQLHLALTIPGPHRHLTQALAHDRRGALGRD